MVANNMLIKLSVTIFFLIVSLLSLTACRDSLPYEVAATQSVAFKGVTVIPMTSEIKLKNHTVLVHKGLIENIGPDGSISIPDDAVIIEAKNYFLMPGLADMHIHPLCNTSDPSCSLGAKEVQVYLAKGVTSVLSMQDTGGTSRNLVKEALGDPILDGSMAGPTVYVASFAAGPGDLNDISDPSQVVITEQDGVDHVRASKEQGYDFIKVYDGVSEPAFKGIISQAERENMRVIGHFPQGEPTGILTNGLDMVAHSGAYLWRYFNFNLDPNLITAATEITLYNQIYINTTLALEKKKTQLACADEVAFQELLAKPETRYANSIELGIWRSFFLGLTDFPGCTPEIVLARYEFIQQYVKSFHDNGVKLVLGTDSPLVWGVPGFSAHEELRALTELGLSPFETLTIATRNAGEFIDHSLPEAESFGTIETGKRADMILFKKNPLLDIDNLESQAGVMVRGRWFSDENLQNKLKQVAADYAIF